MERKIRQSNEYDSHISMCNASWDNVKPVSDATSSNTNLRRAKLSTASMLNLQKRLGTKMMNKNLMTQASISESSFDIVMRDRCEFPASTLKPAETSEVVMNRKRQRSVYSRNGLLIDPDQLDSLLSILRTDSFCGEFDPEAHSAYVHDKQFAPTLRHSSSAMECHSAVGTNLREAVRLASDSKQRAMHILKKSKCASTNALPTNALPTNFI